MLLCVITSYTWRWFRAIKRYSQMNIYTFCVRHCTGVECIRIFDYKMHPIEFCASKIVDELRFVLWLRLIYQYEFSFIFIPIIRFSFRKCHFCSFAWTKCTKLKTLIVLDFWWFSYSIAHQLKNSLQAFFRSQLFFFEHFNWIVRRFPLQLGFFRHE